jgi:dTDP-4-amino-4,6-dideoxygalactose transaminase/lipopolysaccharide/colanic/teichoic acid biosynthesis glycosyltransferase
MRVLLLTQYYAPEPVDKFTDLARGLRERGHQVEVITGFPCYPHGRTYDGYRQAISRIERMDGTRVIRVPQIADHSRSVWRRALCYFSFARAAATIGLARSRRADVMLVYQSALPTGLAAWFISRCKRIPYVLDVADLWPESVAASGMIRNRAALEVIQRVARFIYARAAAINVITEGYRKNLLALGVDPDKVRVIHSWPASTHLRTEGGATGGAGNKDADQINILYAGTIGPCQHLETVVSAALLVQPDKRIRFTIVGDGVERAALERRALAARAGNIRFLGWRTPAETAELTAKAHLLLVHLKPDAMSRLSIPSKTFAYMAAGRPLLMAVDGEAAELVRKHSCGITAAPSDPAALAEAIRRFAELSTDNREKMGRAARTAFDRYYSPNVLIGQVADSLEAVLEKARSPAYDRYLKRWIDVGASSLGLIVLSPLLALTALVVWLGLGRPILFHQARAGRSGQVFQLIKFRTMSNRRLPSGEMLSDAERLNWLGRVLRSTSLDELPQLWNVLRGEMSLVGPRPLLVDYLPHYTPEQARRHDVRPGLTGLAQVRGRNQLSWRRRLHYDAWYARRSSLRLDMKIMWETVKVLAMRRGVAADGHATMPRLDECQQTTASNEIYVIGAGDHRKVAIRAAQRTRQPSMAIQADSAPHERIYLSPPHVSAGDREMLLEAFDSNWIAPTGPHVDGFERDFCERLGLRHAVATSSGTAAIHLALLALGVRAGDEVICSSLTFTATANAIRYCGAEPVFLDSDRRSWNMDPQLLEDELLQRSQRSDPMPTAVVVVDVFGQCADYGAIVPICLRFGIPLVVDAAESLGATCEGRPAGTHGVVGCFSFNGNKIITTSGGGMVATDDEKLAKRVRHLATQAKDPAAHYEHSEIGYNYRVSNLLAAVGRSQLRLLEDRVAARRANFEYYLSQLGSMAGIEFMPEADYGLSTRWLTCILVHEEMVGASREDVRLALEAANIESRPIWKPMHLQPVHALAPYRGGRVAEDLFRRGLCLPSGSSLTAEQRSRVVDVILRRISASRAAA